MGGSLCIYIYYAAPVIKFILLCKSIIAATAGALHFFVCTPHSNKCAKHGSAAWEDGEKPFFL
jgi:hypothetical protein